jgi:hypothetical protein
MANNGGGELQIVAAGVDINTLDQAIQLHFGATANPLSSTAPTTNQFYQWNGTNLVGYTQQNLVTYCAGAANGSGCTSSSVFTEGGSAGFGTEVLLVSAHTLTRFTYLLSSAGVGCSTLGSTQEQVHRLGEIV